MMKRKQREPEPERVVIHYSDGGVYIAPDGMTASEALRILDANSRTAGLPGGG